MAKWLGQYLTRHIFAGRATTASDADTHEVVVDENGALAAKLVASTATVGNVGVTSLPALPTGTNTIGSVGLTGRNLASSWVIANTAQVSTGYVDLEGKSLVALVIPAGWVSGNITFQASDTAAGTYTDVYDSDGVLVTVQVAGASRVVALVGSALQALSSLRFVKVKSAQAVAADRTIGAIAKG